MVLSLINPKVNYVEDSKVKKEDKSYAATVYETEILGNYVPIALGKQRTTENLAFYPIYLVNEQDDGKTKLTQIGVYEMLISDTSSLLDEDGDLDIDQLIPLLYSNYSYNPQAEEKEAEEKEEEEEEEVATAVVRRGGVGPGPPAGIGGRRRRRRRRRFGPDSAYQYELLPFQMAQYEEDEGAESLLILANGELEEADEN